MPADTPAAVATLFTVPDIAKRLGFSPKSIYRAIDRAGLAAHSQTPSGMKLYTEGQIDEIETYLSTARRDEQQQRHRHEEDDATDQNG